jgi:putative DNA primase/helicase
MQSKKIEMAENLAVDDTILTQILSEKHYAELLKSGLNFRNIIDTDCFTGLVIPYFDPSGKPYTTAKGSPFYRIKPDWSFVANPDEMPKYLSPKGEGNRPYFAPTYSQWDKALRFNKIDIHITEGEKKAAKLGACGYAAIGLAGVHSFMDRAVRNEYAEDTAPHLVEDEEARGGAQSQLDESRVIPELESVGDEFFWKYRKVYIDFDSDIVQKWQIKNALKKLAEWLHSKGADVYIVLIPNELNGDKNGVDDFIARHGVEAYEKALKAAEPAFDREKKKLIFNLPTDPGLFQKASLLWGVLKEHWRYRPGIGWHHWEGDRWELTDDGAGTYIDDDIYRFLSANEWKAQGNGSMANLLRHMKAKLMVRQWNPKTKIAFANGVLDLETRGFTEGHRREDFMTVALPYPYNPYAKCPTWERFISEALKGDSKAVDLVQAFFRWALLPKPEGKLDLEVGWDLYGRAGTGKGTVLETLKNIIGHHNCGNFSSKSISNPNMLAGLLDKRVSISADDSGHMEDFGLYGSIMSNETVLVKLLYKNVFPTTLNTFMVRAYNNFITTPSGAKGLDRRIVAMTFNSQPETIDTDLQEKINAELAGVFNWAWGITNAEMKSRILWAGEVDAVSDASEKMFMANNPVFLFLKENYPKGAKKVPIRDLHYQYTEWRNEGEGKPLGQRKFTEFIQDFGCRQLPKVNGVAPYYIPPISEMNVLQRFGILRGKTKNTEPESTAETAKQVASVAKVASQNLDDSTSCYQEKPIETDIFDEEVAKVAKVAKLSPRVHSTIFSEESDTTNPEVSDKCITTDPHKLEIIETIPIPSPNPNGVVIHTRYLMGEIGNVVISFDKQRLAKEWREYIALAFGYYGTVKKADPGAGRYNWRLVFEKFDKEALERLERKDLSQPPAQR